MPPHLLQVCNVGRIVGGTAACAWTVTRSFPAYRHTVAFLGRIAPDTRAAFAHCELMERQRVTPACIRSINPDVVLLHNTSPRRYDTPLPAPTIIYRHSIAQTIPANITLYCSRWLADRCGGNPQQVCHQAVPRPLQPDGYHDTRPLREELTIGRICTPTINKWPSTLVDFYDSLTNAIDDTNHACGFADLKPSISWEFIGCPDNLQAPLNQALNGRATFLPASWEARSRFWNWDVLLYHNPRVTESFGRTVAEAMRAGCIPIVDDRGGFREQIIPGSGYLCSEPQDFARALTQLQHSADRWKTSQTARTHADNKFSLQRFSTSLQHRFQAAITAFSTQ